MDLSIYNVKLNCSDLISNLFILCVKSHLVYSDELIVAPQDYNSIQKGLLSNLQDKLQVGEATDSLLSHFDYILMAKYYPF